MEHELEFELIALTEITAKIHDRPAGPFRPVVLVVDDERIIADTLGAILDLSGYAPLVAYNAKSALEFAQVIPPDLLISDVVMPGMGGVELAMALSQIVPSCKVLLFSGQAATLDLLSAARSAGFNFPALTKPVHPTAMLAHVSALIPRYATQYLA
jgi:DNA-binding NtrC family response regulator